MHTKINKTFIVFFAVVSLTVAQNRYIYVLHDTFDKVERIYLLDGCSLFNPYATYLISYLRRDSLERVQFYSPLSASPEGALRLPATRDLHTKSLWKTEKETGPVNVFSILSGNLLIYKNPKGIFKCIHFHQGTEKQSMELHTNDTVPQVQSDTGAQLYNTVAVTSAGDRGFILSNGKIYTFSIKGNAPGTTTRLKKIDTPVHSIHVIGNSKLLYITDNTLSCAEFKNEELLYTFHFQIRGEDILENSIIEYISFNPVDPEIAAVVARGKKSDKEYSYLAMGYLNISRRTLTLETIRPQSFKTDKVIPSCTWSPDGQRLAVLTSIKSKLQHDGCGQVIVMAYDILTRKLEQTRFFKPYDQYVKLHSGIAWSLDGAYLFYVRKDQKGERLAYADNRMKHTHTWRLVDENNRSFASIDGIAGPVPRTNGDSVSMEFYIAGRVAKSTVICKTTDFLPVMKPLPFDKQLPAEVFNTALSTADEVIAFEQLVRARKGPARDGSVNIIRNLKKTQIPISSEEIAKAFAQYNQKRIDELAPKQKVYNYKEMTLHNLTSTQQKEQSPSTLQKKELFTFIEKRKGIIKNIVEFEKYIDNLRKKPSGSSVMIDSIIHTLTLQAADSIRNGGDISPVFSRITRVERNLDNLYTRYAVYDEYRNRYDVIKNTIDRIVLGSTGLTSNAVTYVTYLTAWDSTRLSLEATLQQQMQQFALTHTGIPDSGGIPELDKTLLAYKHLGHPRFFKQVNKRFSKKGAEGLNDYFSFDKKVFIITAGSGLFCTGMGALLMLNSYNNLHKYNDARTASEIQHYREKTEREYVWSCVLHTLGAGTLSFSTYYLANFILKKKLAQARISYDTQTASLVWRF